MHTETIGKLWRPIEYLFNNPSYHRMHHPGQQQYLDRNYGGIQIIWDRLFGSYAVENDIPVHGLTVPVTTHNPFRLQYGEFAAAFRDLRAPGNWHDRARYLFALPGWRPGDPTLPPDSEAVSRWRSPIRLYPGPW